MEVGCGLGLRRWGWNKNFCAQEIFRGGSSVYTTGMDSVRFGRVLGVGTRLAAKTLVSAVDAATATNPSAGTAGETRTQGVAPSETRASAAGARVGQKAAETATQVKQARGGLKRGGKRFGEAVWGPFVRLSGVLWLEFTGVFFGIFALTASVAVWKQRGAWQMTATNHDAHVRLLLVSGMAVVFGYFFVSSFVRAHRRSRRR